MRHATYVQQDAVGCWELYVNPTVVVSLSESPPLYQKTHLSGKPTCESHWQIIPPLTTNRRKSPRWLIYLAVQTVLPRSSAWSVTRHTKNISSLRGGNSWVRLTALFALQRDSVEPRWPLRPNYSCPAHTCHCRPLLVASIICLAENVPHDKAWSPKITIIQSQQQSH